MDKPFSFALYTIAISPHQVPLFREVMARLGAEACRFVSVRKPIHNRADMGWGVTEGGEWALEEASQPEEARAVIRTAKTLMSGMRDVGLFEERCRRGLKTIYCGERWFKPPMGMLRLLQPKYFKMARRFVRLLRENKHMYAFPIGIHAARDMARLCGLFAGDWKCAFRAPELEFERKPGGRIWLAQRRRGAEKYCLDKMRMWGYFVEPSKLTPCNQEHKALRILWVGRMLDLKRVDTIIKAVREQADRKRAGEAVPKISLDIYGTGPMEAKLKRLARGYEDVIKFYPPVPIAEVRKLMREHDVYVLASNGYEGWGAVVSEALEEGMKVIGTYEAGSSATILPESQLFHAGDIKRLRRLLATSEEGREGIEDWGATKAGEFLVDFARTAGGV